MSTGSDGGLRLRLLRSGRRSRLGGGLRLRLRSGALALHVDAAAEMRAFGNRHARRNDVAVDRTLVADVDLLARRDVAGDLAEHDHRFGEYLGLDLAIGANGEDVIAQLNGALDLTLDRQIFAAVQFTLDNDGFADIHVVPL